MPTNSSNQRYGNTSSKRQLKMQAEDVAIQAHESFEKLRCWKKVSVLERALHVGRLARVFKNTVVARNLELDEGTVRKYCDIDKLSSYWKSRIAANENYAYVLKAARLDSHPDTPVAEQLPSNESTAQSARSNNGTGGGGRPPAPAPSIAAAAAAMPQPSTPNKAGLGQRQLRPVRRPKPKTSEQLQLEHKLGKLRAKINFTRSPFLREQLELEYLEAERELAALADADSFRPPSDGLAAVGERFGGFFAARRAMVPSRKIKF